MPLLNYTTKIPWERSYTEVKSLLIAHGARGFYEEVGPEGYINSFIFKLRTPDGDVPIKIPIDVESTIKILKKQYDSGEIDRRFTDPKRARNIAWRIIKDWLQAHIWLVETEMMKMEQILLPYMMVDKDHTLYEAMKDRHFLLGEGREK
ncbi:unnamed protein product [marine sediment metagenome]|uniref:Uncharacterized protein n=1 Tax=marine sediment metagenome TaxID=412755 RepID=X1KLN1_9ZZZZ